MAQEAAFKKKKNIEVIWRGYKDIVEPNGPKFTTSDLRGRLLMALREILDMKNKKSFPTREQKIYESLSQMDPSLTTGNSSPHPHTAPPPPPPPPITTTTTTTTTTPPKVVRKTKISLNFAEKEVKIFDLIYE